jgi:hypothetical protein
MAFQSQSQVKPFRFGVKVAPNMAWISPDTKDYEYDGMSMGFSWGFLADITLADNYFVKTGFSIDYLNAKLKYPHQMKLDDTEENLTQGTMYRKYKLRYLEIPLTLKMRTNQFGEFAFYGEIGFGTAFNLKSKSDDRFVFNNDNELETIEDIKDEISFIRESLIVGAGIEYFIDESTSLVTSINFSSGLTNLLSGETSMDPGVKQRGQLNYLQLNIGIMF